jgi:hypothetical protein
MSDAFSFTKLVPGFDFLQGLAKTAGAALPGIPGIGQWVAPTLNPEEIEKRIGELRTVQFWLEQNARMLGATIQALEVQRMTLSTLKTMNVQMGDLRESLTAAVPVFAGAVTGKKEAQPAADQAADDVSLPPADVKPPPADVKPPPGVDPMQWWGALTQQFTELASKAVKDNATDAAKRMVGGVAGAMVKQGMNVAEQTMKAAAGMPARAVRSTTARVAKGGAAKSSTAPKSAPRKTVAAKTGARKR